MIIQNGLERMYVRRDSVFYYITVMNENYQHPPMPDGVEDGIIKGMYRLQQGAEGEKKVQLLGCGTILREVIAAAELLKQDFDVNADIWSVTSFNELRREGLDLERHNRLHPEQDNQLPYVTRCLGESEGPVVAATDYMKIYADQIREFIPKNYHVLGTDGFGRSDTREKLRRHFEVNRFHIAVTALHALVEEGKLPADTLTDAIRQYNIDPDKPNPAYA